MVDNIGAMLLETDITSADLNTEVNFFQQTFADNYFYGNNWPDQYYTRVKNFWYSCSITPQIPTYGDDENTGYSYTYTAGSEVSGSVTIDGG